jgi:hypothetical protein
MRLRRIERDRGAFCQGLRNIEARGGGFGQSKLLAAGLSRPGCRHKISG